MKGITPDVMDVVQSTDLREESSKRFRVFRPKVDGASPVVAPFDHRARFQHIVSHFINIGPSPILDLRPKAEIQHVLNVPRTDAVSLLSPELLESLFRII